MHLHRATLFLTHLNTELEKSSYEPLWGLCEMINGFLQKPFLDRYVMVFLFVINAVSLKWGSPANLETCEQKKAEDHMCKWKPEITQTSGKLAIYITFKTYWRKSATVQLACYKLAPPSQPVKLFKKKKHTHKRIEKNSSILHYPPSCPGRLSPRHPIDNSDHHCLVIMVYDC